MIPKQRIREAEGAARLRGRAGVEQRLRRLANEPLCRRCLETGITTAATVPDHIKPLALGGTDDDTNIQCLCDPCHAIKTAAEGAAFEGAANHPDWLEPSAIPLTIVCGPPCAGKTTYIDANAGPFDTIIDLDVIARELSPTYRHWEGQLFGALFNQAIRVRNQMLGSLSTKRGGRAWFIVSAPTKEEREWWQGKLGCEVLLLNPGADECRRRAVSRGTPRAIAGVDDWFATAQRPWAARARRVQRAAIGEDGWPVEEAEV
jgi:hypothetical protein